MTIKRGNATEDLNRGYNEVQENAQKSNQSMTDEEKLLASFKEAGKDNGLAHVVKRNRTNPNGR